MKAMSRGMLLVLLLALASCGRSSVPSAEGGPAAPSADLAASAGAAPKPELSYLNTGEARSKPQLLSGWHAIEEGSWRWMAREGQAVLLAPQQWPVNFELKLFFPSDHMKRAGGPVTVSVLLSGTLFAQETYSRPGVYTLTQPVPPGAVSTAAPKLTIRLNRALPPSDADKRELGAVVQAFGFVKP